MEKNLQYLTPKMKTKLLRIDEVTHRKLKIRAAQEGIAIGKLIKQLLETKKVEVKSKNAK